MNKHQFPRFTQTYSQNWLDSGLWLDRTLHQGFDETVESSPEKTAIVTEGVTYTFAQFKSDTDALAAGLLGIGIGRGDIVAVQLPNWYEFCCLQIALSRIGAVIQPTHLVFREREIANLYKFCQTDAVVVAETVKDFQFADMMRKLRPDLPDLKSLIIARGEARGEGEHALSHLIAEGHKNLDRLEEINVSPSEIFYLNFTSGTEGNPKGFLHSHNTLISLMQMLSQYTVIQKPDTVNLTCSPMTHSFGHFYTYYCALAGMPLVLMDRFSPIEALKLIEKWRISALSGTPAHLISILRHADFNRFDTSCVDSVAVGGARSAPELIGELREIWGIQPANTYGMGETIIHTRTAPDDSDDKIESSVGKPVFGSQLKIVHPKDRSLEQSVGEVGEICFRGPTLFVGYHNQQVKTAETRDDEGWFYTGDLGFVDEHGYLYFAGRATEVINRGGSKIYPKEIEDVLCQHPDIADAAVVGMPDERLGERVCAYIVPEATKTVTLDQVQAFFRREKVMKYMFPEFLISMEQFPMTATGKIRKASLQEDARQKSAQLRDL